MTGSKKHPVATQLLWLLTHLNSKNASGQGHHAQTVFNQLHAASRQANVDSTDDLVHWAQTYQDGLAQETVVCHDVVVSLSRQIIQWGTDAKLTATVPVSDSSVLPDFRQQTQPVSCRNSQPLSHDSIHPPRQPAALGPYDLGQDGSLLASLVADALGDEAAHASQTASNGTYSLEETLWAAGQADALGDEVARANQTASNGMYSVEETQLAEGQAATLGGEAAHASQTASNGTYSLEETQLAEGQAATLGNEAAHASQTASNGMYSVEEYPPHVQPHYPAAHPRHTDHACTAVTGVQLGYNSAMHTSHSMRQQGLTHFPVLQHSQPDASQWSAASADTHGSEQQGVDFACATSATASPVSSLSSLGLDGCFEPDDAVNGPGPTESPEQTSMHPDQIGCLSNASMGLRSPDSQQRFAQIEQIFASIKDKVARGEKPDNAELGELEKKLQVCQLHPCYYASRLMHFLCVCHGISVTILPP